MKRPEVKEYCETIYRADNWKYIKAQDKFIDQILAEKKALTKDANKFIIEIAELLRIDTDGIGYDDLKLSIEDFEDAIKQLVK